MKDNDVSIWDQRITQQLSGALVAITDQQLMKNFLRDVMTEKEIIEISSRLEAARLLTIGEKYTEITKKTKLSSRTVARISDWLKNGCTGYKTVINTMVAHEHIPPVRAE